MPKPYFLAIQKSHKSCITPEMETPHDPAYAGYGNIAAKNKREIIIEAFSIIGVKA